MMEGYQFPKQLDEALGPRDNFECRKAHQSFIIRYLSFDLLYGQFTFNLLLLRLCNLSRYFQFESIIKKLTYCPSTFYFQLKRRWQLCVFGSFLGGWGQIENTYLVRLYMEAHGLYNISKIVILEKEMFSPSRLTLSLSP